MITLILPAYNEAGSIAATLDEVKAYFESRSLPHQIIVAADGDDGTRELVAERARTDPSVRVIGNVERRGKGYGIRQAMALAEGDIVGFADADNKTPIDEFDKFGPLFEQGYDLVIGSRAAGAKIERPQPWYRRWGSRGFGVLMHAVVGLPDIRDTQCGFKFFKEPVARALFASQTIDGYMFDVEILYLARLAGYKIAQVPVRWRDDHDSRLQLLSGNLRNLRDVLRVRAMHAKPAVAPLAEARPAVAESGFANND